MRWRYCAPCLSLIVVALAAIDRTNPTEAKSSEKASDVIVHEWGTFLSMQGSDGVALDGMYHEEHALPNFVHARSRDQLHLPSTRLKGETPVIYFYTQREQNVSVDVRFPSGIWTQWYPQAAFVAPGLASQGSELEPRDGRIGWRVRLIPNSDQANKPSPPATSDDALWNFARNVDAATVRTVNRANQREQDEFERFIFYRGLGRAKLPIELSTEDGGTLRTPSTGDIDLLHLFVIRVQDGRGAYKYLPRLEPGRAESHAIPDMTEALPLDEFASVMCDELAKRLTGNGLYPKEARLASQQPQSPAGPFLWSGLYEKEARAMVNTWRTSYFQTEGIRVLFVLPQKWTDAFVPMQIGPQPKEVVRVMVGRLEVLTPERERLAENAVRDLASPIDQVRTEAFEYLREQGRYVEPIVRRVLAATTDESVRTLSQRLLLSDFVTDLRAAVNSPADGSRVREEPLYVRAKLASLLRNVGETEPAKKEAREVLELLASQKEPPMSSDSARHYLRAKARALEGLGDDAAATEWYAKFIRFGSQITPESECSVCHQGNPAPQNLAWYRDWWVGRSFARSAARAGKTNELIKAQELAAGKNSQDPAALMMLAYLYEADGQAPEANAAWTKLGVRSEPIALSQARQLERIESEDSH